jgi:hypothetical protein
MIELYKILTGKYDEDVFNLLRTRDESTTRGRQYKLYNKGNNKITELRTILQRESQNS